MTMARKMAGAAAFLFVSINAFAEPPARDKATSQPNAAPATVSQRPVEDPAATATRLEEQARRAENAARDGRTQVSALNAVARLARSKADVLSGADRLEAEEGLAYLQAHIQAIEATSRGDDRTAAEYRATAERVRARAGASAAAGKGDSGATAACDPPFSFDPEGHKRWRPECL